MRFPRPAPTGALLTLAVVVPTAVVAPTFTTSRPEPHPVPSSIQQVALNGVDADSLDSVPAPDGLRDAVRALNGPNTTAATRTAVAAVDEREPYVLTEPLSTDGYRMLGVTWRGAAPSPDSAVIVSARSHADSGWSNWFEIPTMVDNGTQASPNGRYGTEPYWVGEADGVQIRVDTVGGVRPVDVRADLIEPGTMASVIDSSESWPIVCSMRAISTSSGPM